jgi:nucleoid-associated protein YgaU/two-component SAPR family response regulator
VDRRQVEDNIPHSSARGERAKLVGFGGLMLVAGVGLAAAAGPPRLPSGPPRLDDVLTVLAGTTLPLDPLLLVLVDVTWVVWTWITLSLLLESALAAADLVTHGGSLWVHSLRHIVDRASVPLVRRAVAAAFAVQVISRGVPIAAAQTLPPVDAIVVSTPNATGRSIGATNNVPDLTPTYLVRPGDTLWSIAEQAYGSGMEYRRLVDANVGRPMSDGQVFSARGVIRPGWQLVVPGASWQTEDVDGQRWYTVRPGDTLSSIASTTLGDPQRWTELFDLNRGAVADDGIHVLIDANTIWPGLRLRLPDATDQTDTVSDPVSTELRAASATPSVADRHTDDPPQDAPAPSATLDPAAQNTDTQPAAEPTTPPPLQRTIHAFQPVTLDPADSSSTEPEPAADSASPEAAGAGSAADSEVSLPAPPWRSDVPVVPLAVGGLGLAAAAGVAFGARRLRRLRPLPRVPESEVVVEGGFAEAQLAQDLTRGLHGFGFDPVAALVDQWQQFLSESSPATAAHAGVLAVRHGRSSTTLTIRCGLADQAPLLELAPAFAQLLEAEVEACVSADQDVLWRLARVRKTRLLPSANLGTAGACMVPLGVLYDRQAYSVALSSLGHVLVASLPAHGADTILTSLVATLTARRSPQQLQVWTLGSARALPAPLFELPHLARVVDPADESALLLAAEDLRVELDARAARPPDSELLIVIPELSALGEHSARFALLAARAANLGVHFVAAASDPEQAVGDPLTANFGTRMVLRMHSEEASVALLGVADAAFLGGGGRLLLRLDGREPVELYGFQVTSEHLERLVKVMRSAYAALDTAQPGPPRLSDTPPATGPTQPTDSPSPDSAASEPSRADEPDVPPHCNGTAADGAAPQAATTAQAPIQIYCFGAPRVECAGQTVWPSGAGDAKPWELLLFVASQPADGVSREALVNALWPQDELVEDIAHRLRQLRFRLRRQFQRVPGGPHADGICLDRRVLRVDPGLVHSDAQEFLALVRSIRINPGGDAIDRLERARALYVGDLLTGPDVRRYAWLDERDNSGVTLREHFRCLFENASTRLAELYAEAGQLVAAIDLYRELTELDPGDERRWQALFQLHARRGDREALVAEEQRLRQTLRELAEELEVADDAQADEPSREITQEYQRLLSGLMEREPAVA